MKSNLEQILVLKHQLVQFGLNPEEWRMVPRPPEGFMLIHKQQSSLRMIGRATLQSRRWGWRKLRLISL